MPAAIIAITDEVRDDGDDHGCRDLHGRDDDGRGHDCDHDCMGHRGHGGGDCDHDYDVRDCMVHHVHDDAIITASKCSGHLIGFISS